MNIVNIMNDYSVNSGSSKIVHCHILLCVNIMNGYSSGYTIIKLMHVDHNNNNYDCICEDKTANLKS